MNVNFINVEEFRLLDEQNRGATLQAIVLPASDSYDPNKNYNLIVRSLEYNSLTEVNFSDNLGLSNSLIASLGIEYDITEGVSFDENGGVDFSDQRNERRQGPHTREGSIAGHSQLGENMFVNYVLMDTSVLLQMWVKTINCLSF